LRDVAGRALTYYGFRRSVYTSPILTLMNMNFPVYIPIGSLKIHPHLAFETAAYVIAFRIYLTLRKRAGDALDDGNRWWIIAAAAMGAMVGSKSLYWFEDPALTLAHWREIAFLMSGKTIVGALIGALVAVELAKQILGITRRTGDLFAVPLCVGIAIGRIGCFLTGLEDHTAGTATSLPWGVNFGDGIHRHPTQLYEVLFALALGGYLWRRMHRPVFPGDIFKMFMVAYFAFRLACDFLKPGVREFLGMSSIQLACVAMLLYYSPDWLRWLNPYPRFMPAATDPTASQSVAPDQTGGGIG
jgi:phosphatidylglycerol---prolipoprotein diacylglyceryl transferase